MQSSATNQRRQKIAVIGSGISGLSCAWALAHAHDVTLYEADRRLGGHANTVEIARDGEEIAVDTGFIVYNEKTYPNLTALFRHLEIDTAPAEMSFAVSRDGGDFEYAGKDFWSLFAQPGQLLKLRFWAMIFDLLRFYRQGRRDLAALDAADTAVSWRELTLDQYLARNHFGAAFVQDHLLPMAAAIWSTPPAEVGAFPAESFLRFCDNHGLIQLLDRPQWRTPRGGSRHYVVKLAEKIQTIRLSTPIQRVSRRPDGVELFDRKGHGERFDAAVIAAHADAALALIEQPSPDEARLLGAFRYADNHAVLHGDPQLMPRRRAAWAAWNFLSDGAAPNFLADGKDKPAELAVTYWMNVLQPLKTRRDLFVTLNPPRPPREELSYWRATYRHPQFDAAAIRAQKQLWSLQGRDRLWFAGAWFGAGFHEDGLQAGLAVAEQLGGLRRPWRVAAESGRICFGPAPAPQPGAFAS